MIFLTTYPTHITFSDIVINFIVWSIVIVLFLNRKKSDKNTKAWEVVATFFGALLLILGTNYAKKKVKDWWNKD
jgi:preprotein translocase subunit SecG